MLGHRATASQSEATSSPSEKILGYCQKESGEMMNENGFFSHLSPQLEAPALPLEDSLFCPCVPAKYLLKPRSVSLPENLVTFRKNPFAFKENP